MHRSFEISLPSEATDGLVADLRASEEVVALHLHPGASLEPQGDVLVVHTLNRGADAVLEVIMAARREHEITVITGETGAIVQPGLAEEIRSDTDDAIWEEVETGLLHHAGITKNFLALMACGGVVAATGFLFESPIAATISFVSASVIAPGFEVLAKLPYAIAMRRWAMLLEGLRASVAGYAVLAAAAALTFLLLDASGTVTASTYDKSSKLMQLASP